MADFLNDYSGIAAAGSAFEGFAKGMMDAEDRKYKRIEQQAMLEATRTKMDREKAHQDLEQMKFDATQSPEAKRGQAILSAGAHGQMPVFDEGGNVTDVGYKPEYMQMKKDALNADPTGAKALTAQLAEQNLVKAKGENAERSRERASTPVPGFTKGPGYNADKVQERALTDGYVSIQKFNRTMGSLKDKVSKADVKDLANPASNVRKSIEQDLKNLQLLYKGPAFAQLGVLAGPDMAILDSVIENPGTLSNLISGKKGVTSRYDSLLNNVNAGFNDAALAHGLVLAPQAAKPQGMLKKQGMVNAGGLLHPGEASPPPDVMAQKQKRLEELRRKAAGE